MKSLWSIGFVVLGAGGFVVILLNFYSSSHPDGASLPLPVEPARPVASKLALEIREMREEIHGLHDRLTALETRPIPAMRVPDREKTSKAVIEKLRNEASKDEMFENFKDEIRARMTDFEALRASPRNLKAQVAEAVTTLQKQNAVKYYRRVEEKQASQLEERLAHLSDNLSLDDYQMDELRTILTTQQENNLEVIRMWEEGADDQFIGDTKRANAEAHQSALRLVLTQVQLETYHASEKEGDDKD